VSISCISSIFDVEEETLISPLYKRGYIQQILLAKAWKSEEFYLAYVHSILFEIGMYSSYYYHLYCVSDIDPDDDNNTRERNFKSGKDIIHIEDPVVPKSRSESMPHLNMTLKNFFNKYKIEESDIDIIKYFAETIIKQQTLEMSGGKEVAITHLDYCEVHLFKKMEKL